MLKEDLAHYIGLYQTWSSYQPEAAGVTLAYCSIHGNTAAAALQLKAMLEEKGVAVAAFDLARDSMSETVASAFRYDKLVLAAPTYDAALFPVMEDFLYHLKAKNYQKRTIAILENGSWAPMAGKLMRAYAAEGFKGCTLVEPVITLRGKLNGQNQAALAALVDTLTA